MSIGIGIGVGPTLTQGVGVPALGASFLAGLRTGASDAILLVAGDSTGNGSDEWVYRLCVDLEANELTHYIDYYLYDNTTKTHLLAALLGRQSTFGLMTDTFNRADGALGTTSSGGQTWNANSWTVAANKAIPNAINSTLKLATALPSTSFKLKVDINRPTSGDCRVYFLDGNSRQMFCSIRSTGNMDLFMNDGTTNAVVATTTIGAATGTFTLTIVKDGLTVYCEYNGFQILFALTSTQDTNLTGRGVFLDSVTSVTGHAYDNMQVGVITKPAHKLTVRNGSVSGTGFTYHTTNIATIIPERPDFALVNLGHNETASAPATFLANYVTYVAALRAQAGGAAVPIAAVVQNPETLPSTNVAAHAANMIALRGACAANGWDRANIYDAFNNDPGGLALLVNPADGIHPVTAGSILWESTVATRLGLH